MPEWLIERGIGETRAALAESGRILEARIELDGAIAAGAVVEARLVSVGRGGRGALARTDDGVELMLPVRPAGISEGGRLAVAITRAAIPGAEPWKRPLGRATDEKPRAAPPLEERLGGRLLSFPPHGRDALEEAGWSDLLEEAGSGIVRFEGGELRVAATPAMTLIDVDGWLAPAELAVAGAAAAGQAIRRLDIGGSIGIDLPTIAGKSARTAAGDSLDRALTGVGFERTAVNGFGFVQVVRPRLRASLVELAADRATFTARALLRRAALESSGACRLVAHPRVVAELERRPEWLAALSAQRGGQAGLRADPALAISAAHVEPS